MRDIEHPKGTRLFIGVSADRPMEVQFTEADGPGEGFYSGADYDALATAYRGAVEALEQIASRDTLVTQTTAGCRRVAREALAIALRKERRDV